MLHRLINLLRISKIMRNDYTENQTKNLHILRVIPRFWTSKKVPKQMTDIHLVAPWRAELVTWDILHWKMVIISLKLYFSLMHYKTEGRHYQNSVSFQRWNYELFSAWDWTTKFIRSYNITALLFPTNSPATFNSYCKQNRRARFVAKLILWLFLQVYKDCEA
jgi:hypothetical protein